MAEDGSTGVYETFAEDNIRQAAAYLTRTVVLGGPPNEPWDEALLAQATELGMAAELHTERCVRAIRTAWRGLVSDAAALVADRPETGAWSMEVEWCIARAVVHMHAGAAGTALGLLEVPGDLADVERRWGAGVMEALRAQAAYLAGDWDRTLVEARAAVMRAASHRTGAAWVVLAAAVGALVAVARDDLELAAELLDDDAVRHGAVGRPHVGAGHLLLATAELREASTARRERPDESPRTLQLRSWAARADADAHIAVHTPLHVASIAPLGVPPARHLPVNMHDLRVYVRDHPQPPGAENAAPLPRAAFDLLHDRQLTAPEHLEDTGVPYLEARFLEEAVLAGAGAGGGGDDGADGADGGDAAAQRVLRTYEQLGAVRDVRRCQRRLAGRAT